MGRPCRWHAHRGRIVPGCLGCRAEFAALEVPAGPLLRWKVPA